MKKKEPIELLKDVHWQKIIKKKDVDGADRFCLFKIHQGTIFNYDHKVKALYMCIVRVHAYTLSAHLTYSIYFHHRLTLLHCIRYKLCEKSCKPKSC